MELEYLQGRIEQRSPTDPRWHVTVLDGERGAVGRTTLADLGADRWKLCAAWVHDDTVHCIFRRIKLYPIAPE